jgi:hypothetical protein
MAQLSGRSCAMKGGVDLIAILLGQTGGSSADLSAWRCREYLKGGGVDGKHANFADGPDAGTSEEDGNDP